MYLEGASTSTTQRIHFLNVSGLFTFNRLHGPLREIFLRVQFLQNLYLDCYLDHGRKTS